MKKVVFNKLLTGWPIILSRGKAIVLMDIFLKRWPLGNEQSCSLETISFVLSNHKLHFWT